MTELVARRDGILSSRGAERRGIPAFPCAYRCATDSAYTAARSTGSRDDWGDTPAIALGSRVSHAQFGEGIVTAAEGQGNHARVQIHFEDAGSKWLVLAYANLVVLG